jgi:hypothetical protein
MFYVLLDFDNTTVIEMFEPMHTLAAIEAHPEIIQGRKLIEVNIDNSPVYLGGTYRDGKFYKPEKEIKYTRQELER